MREILNEFMLNTLTPVEMAGRLDWLAVFLSLGVALLCGLVIYWTYRKFFRGVVYDDNFNILLLLVTLITAFVIMTISSNLLLSLGLVGALSIVRFRAAIKDPLDTGFIFWAVAAGVAAGAGLYLVGLVGTLVIAIVFIGSTLLKTTKVNYLIVLKYKPTAEDAVHHLLHEQKKHYTLKNKTQTARQTELTLEIHDDDDLDQALKKIDGVESVVKVQYNGNYLG